MPPALNLALGQLQDQLLECLPPFATFSDAAMLICQLEIAQCCTASYTFAEYSGFEVELELAFSDLPRCETTSAILCFTAQVGLVGDSACSAWDSTSNSEFVVSVALLCLILVGQR